MIEHLMVSENIVHAGALLYLAGFLFRNQLILRGLIIAGDFVYVLYFYFAPEVPLWGGIFWSTMFTVVNVAMIALIVADRMHFRLDQNEKQLFDLLQDLSPGQFRQFLKIGREEIAASHLAITQEGRPLEELFFVLNRSIMIEKKGSRAVTQSDTFIGEIAFLLDQPATATVTLEPGTPYFVWKTSELKKLMQSKPDLGTSLSLAMNKKMAQKIAVGGFLHDMIAQEARN
jgi:Popeye protein conserved region